MPMDFAFLGYKISDEFYADLTMQLRREEAMKGNKCSIFKDL